MVRESSNSVEKALKILITLANHEDGIKTGQLSEELGFSKPTTSRLLGILSKYDFVQRNPCGMKYILGKSILDIGREASKHIIYQLVPVAKPYIDKLRDEINESALLELMIGDNMMLIYRANGPHPVGILVSLGTMIPVHISPGGKSILAFSSNQIVDRILNKELARYTEKTITDPIILKRNLKKIRQEGIAYSYGEYNIDIDAIGAPIFNHEKKPIAAVVITIPTYRNKNYKRSKLAYLIKDTARKISDELFRYGF